jgi:hypothetical protein
MAFRAEPPDLDMRAKTHIVRRERRVLRGVPLTGELPVRLSKRWFSVLFHREILIEVSKGADHVASARARHRASAPDTRLFNMFVCSRDTFQKTKIVNLPYGINNRYFKTWPQIGSQK